MTPNLTHKVKERSLCSKVLLSNVPIIGWSWLLPPGPRLSLGAGCGSGCGAGGEDRQEFQILIFGSKCPPTTATTITAINTAIFFSITITI